jgi:threonine/homoserine/homoserine lactone efflux protein
VVFAAIPGPSNLYVVSQGLRAGRRSALITAVGCALGAWTYVVATALGLAALLASSATTLSVLHYVGGAYLILLGVRTFRRRRSALEVTQTAAPAGGRFVRRGLLIELSNPKVALFFLALFPQFVHVSRGAIWSQVLVLGGVFCLIGLASDSLYAFASGALHRNLARNRRALARGNALSGVICVGLGAWSMWSGARTRAAG